MKSSRRLALRRETLTELTDADLSFGGGALPTLAAGCSVDEITAICREVMLELTLHPHCSWSCI